MNNFLQIAGALPGRLKDRMETQRQLLLRQLPKVDDLWQECRNSPAFAGLPKNLVMRLIRQTLDDMRRAVLKRESAALPAAISMAGVLAAVHQAAQAARLPHLRRVINATGVIIHTNLGRSPLSAAVVQEIAEVARHYSTLEYDLAAGRRGSRHDHLEGILQELTGAEAVLVVNNNAGAVLLTLNTLAQDREVIVSRGQLVEIGGSFRMPDVMTASGARLREVGTTNKTHLRDYETAISPDTAMLLKVHTSNYRIFGFTREVPLAELVALGRRHQLPVVEDLGSGCLIDLGRYGLEAEPTVPEALAAGADLVMFSGDKLLGGPQAGIVLGSRSLVDRLKSNPLTRALRPDKMTLAGLEATLRLYREESRAVQDIPTLWMLTCPVVELQKRARRLAGRLRRRLPSTVTVRLLPSEARVGGGALPQLVLPSLALVLEDPGLAAHHLEERLRQASTPVIGRLEKDRLLLDVRTLLPEDEGLFLEVVSQLWKPRTTAPLRTS